jgi:hypothetical protein
MNTQKDQLVEISHNQQSPGDARPEDFKTESEEIEFGGACGDNQREYNELLKVGPRGRVLSAPTAAGTQGTRFF